MKNKIKMIQDKINQVKLDNAQKMNDLQDQVIALIIGHLDGPYQDKVKAMVNLVEQSKDLTSDEHDEWPLLYARVDLGVLDLDLSNDLVKEALKTYFQDNYTFGIDFANSCLTMTQGPCILINDEGDVLDQESGKWIISRKDYKTKEERNTLIEAHMEKSGYFPSVVMVDRYGNMNYISTQSSLALN